MKSGIQFAVALMGVFLMVSTAVAQKGQPAVKVKKIEVELQPTPVFEAGGGVKTKKIPRQKTWLEVEVEFEVKAGNKEGVVDNLQFRYYVAIKGAEGTRLLMGDVTHVNMMEGDKLFSVIYVSPTTLGKLTGKYKDFQKSAINAVAVEISYNGRVIGGDSTGGKGRWWESLSAEQGILSKEKTPFGLLWIDRYADVKEGR
ncbi:MAG: hypothetical protein QM496_14940 [Verrucomicrobiota bacterium]